MRNRKATDPAELITFSLFVVVVGATIVALAPTAFGILLLCITIWGSVVLGLGPRKLLGVVFNRGASDHAPTQDATITLRKDGDWWVARNEKTGATTREKKQLKALVMLDKHDDLPNPERENEVDASRVSFPDAFQ